MEKHNMKIITPKEEEAKRLWSKLGDIPTNEEEEIEEAFEGFEAGTDKYEIWHWFEEKFDIRVVDLMFKNMP